MTNFHQNNSQNNSQNNRQNINENGSWRQRFHTGANEQPQQYDRNSKRDERNHRAPNNVDRRYGREDETNYDHHDRNNRYRGRDNRYQARDSRHQGRDDNSSFSKYNKRNSHDERRRHGDDNRIREAQYVKEEKIKEVPLPYEDLFPILSSRHPSEPSVKESVEHQEGNYKTKIMTNTEVKKTESLPTLSPGWMEIKKVFPDKQATVKHFVQNPDEELKNKAKLQRRVNESMDYLTSTWNIHADNHYKNYGELSLLDEECVNLENLSSDSEESSVHSDNDDVSYTSETYYSE